MSQSVSQSREGTLDIAARSLLASQAISGTVAGVLADRALDHAFEGLYHFAVVRIGIERADVLLRGFVETVESSDRASLDAGAGPRANLYRLLRSMLAKEPLSPLSPHSSSWWPVAGDAERFAALREAVPPSDAEILELRFARRLSVEEIAHVIDIDVESVCAVVARGLETSHAHFGRKPPSHDRSHDGVWLEAFALDPKRVPALRRTLRKPVLEPGAIVASRYEVEALLGVGAFADVYRARDCEVTGHVVALKILRTRAMDSRAVHAALRELQLLASVFHPSVVQLKDHGWQDGHLWFVMPLYRGETLAARLERGPLSRREARGIFEQLAEALATMHRAGVRHQDVKPENVFLASLDLESDDVSASERVLPVLLDLGVAAKDAELVLAGTPAYFAPEVAARFARVPDPPPVGPKADVFSLALTLRRALEPSRTETFPVGAVDAFVAYRARHAPLPPQSRELADLKPSFSRWLATSPDKRPTAEAFRRELAALTQPEERAARRAAMRRWIIPVTAAVLAIFVAVVSELSREAAVSRAEAMRASERADRARERAASISQTLNEQEARRAELEADVERLENEYQTSRMTREQLASRLARTEGELAVLGDRDHLQSGRLRQQSDALEQLEAERARIASQLAVTETRATELGEVLTRERLRGTDAESNVQRLTEQLRSTQSSLALSLMRLAELEERITAIDDRERRIRTPLVLSPDVPRMP